MSHFFSVLPMPRVLALLAVCSLSSCYVLSAEDVPAVDYELIAASQYNFRGMVNNEKGVIQGEAAVTHPTAWANGFLTVAAWANFDLQNDTGDAWFPDGHQGEPSEIDLKVAYSETYHEFDITAGVESYALQNPDDFPLTGERGETKEAFVEVGRLVPFDLYPAVSVHFDFDEVDGWYMTGSVAREFPLDEKLTADAKVALSYSDEEASDWTYGLDAAGLADLRVSGALNYFYDDHTTLLTSLNFATIVDDELSDWFDAIGIESDNFWITLGVVWGY